jgi:hypothetical protein
MELIRYQRPLSREEAEEARLWSLWLLYGKAPSKAQPDFDGMYDLSEIGETRSDKGIERATPYSPGRVK